MRLYEESSSSKNEAGSEIARGSSYCFQQMCILSCRDGIAYAVYPSQFGFPWSLFHNSLRPGEVIRWLPVLVPVVIQEYARFLVGWCTEGIGMSFNILFSRVSDPFLVNLLCITELESDRVTFIVVDSITVSGVSQISAKETSICFPSPGFILVVSSRNRLFPCELS